MTDAERKLLLLVARLLADDPSTCLRIGEGVPWNDPLRGHGHQRDQDLGYDIINNLIDDVEQRKS